MIFCHSQAALLASLILLVGRFPDIELFGQLGSYMVLELRFWKPLDEASLFAFVPCLYYASLCVWIFTSPVGRRYLCMREGIECLDEHCFAISQQLKSFEELAL